MAAMNIEVRMPRRRAKLCIDNEFTAEAMGLSVGEHNCYVLATLQMDCSPVFVCEFLDGTVKNVYTELIQFVDIVEES